MSEVYPQKKNAAVKNVILQSIYFHVLRKKIPEEKTLSDFVTFKEKGNPSDFVYDLWKLSGVG